MKHPFYWDLAEDEITGSFTPILTNTINSSRSTRSAGDEEEIVSYWDLLRNAFSQALHVDFNELCPDWDGSDLDGKIEQLYNLVVEVSSSRAFQKILSSYEFSRFEVSPDVFLLPGGFLVERKVVYPQLNVPKLLKDCTEEIIVEDVSKVSYKLLAVGVQSIVEYCVGKPLMKLIDWEYIAEVEIAQRRAIQLRNKERQIASLLTTRKRSSRIQSKEDKERAEREAQEEREREEEEKKARRAELKRYRQARQRAKEGLYVVLKERRQKDLLKAGSKRADSEFDLHVEQVPGEYVPGLKPAEMTEQAAKQRADAAAQKKLEESEPKVVSVESGAKLSEDEPKIESTEDEPKLPEDEPKLPEDGPKIESIETDQTTHLDADGDLAVVDASAPETSPEQEILYPGDWLFECYCGLREINHEAKSIQCDECKRWLHLKCQDRQVQREALAENGSFFCLWCMQDLENEVREQILAEEAEQKEKEERRKHNKRIREEKKRQEMLLLAEAEAKAALESAKKASVANGDETEDEAASDQDAIPIAAPMLPTQTGDFHTPVKAAQLQTPVQNLILNPPPQHTPLPMPLQHTPQGAVRTPTLPVHMSVLPVQFPVQRPVQPAQEVSQTSAPVMDVPPAHVALPPLQSNGQQLPGVPETAPVNSALVGHRVPSPVTPGMPQGSAPISGHNLLAQPPHFQPVEVSQQQFSPAQPQQDVPQQGLPQQSQQQPPFGRF